MINTLPIVSSSRNPRGLVFINGIQVLWESLEVETNTYFVADNFSVAIPLNSQINGFNDKYFADTQAMMVEIYTGFPNDPDNFTKNELQSIFKGQVDQVEFDYEHFLVTLSGRDLTAKFIDNKTTEKYPNLTSSQIVTLLAKREGLTANVTKTSTPAGRYYAANTANLTAEIPEWNLITYLAQQEGFSAYVEGTTLYFNPAPTEKDDPYVIQWSKPSGKIGYPVSNLISLKMERSLTVARDIIVIIRSNVSRSKRGFNVRLRATPNKKTKLAQAAQPIGDAQTFTRTVLGLTREQALQYARRLLAELSQHERNIEAEMPADNLLKKISVVQLKGTGTSFDQTYFTSSIHRRFNLNEGYRMTVKAKNHSPNSEVEF